MTAYRLLDFADIVDAVMEELKLQSDDTTSANKIKRWINEVYIDEVVPFKRWSWATGHVSIKHKAYYGDGTASVTPDSTTVTLSTPPLAATGSRANYKFAVDNFDEVYTISSHTAGSATITLDSAYNGALNTTASYKIWLDTVDLPTDAVEVTTVWHDYHKQEVVGKGSQEFRRIVAESPKAEGRPIYFNQADFYDSSGSEDETDRVRQLRIYPSISQEATTLHIDYQKEVSALELDGDEPILPIADRVVLKYGALARAWPALARNPEEGQRNQLLYEAKLSRMAGKVEDGFDKPQLTPESRYMAQKRGPRIKSASRYHGANGGGSSYTAPTYIKNATIEGGNVTANITVDSGITIDGRDISVDGAAADAHIAASTNVHGIGSGNAVVGTGTTQTLTNKTLAVASNSVTGTANKVGQFGSGGALEAGTVTTTELNYLVGTSSLVSVTLNDNQAAAANVATFDPLYTWEIEYSLQRTTSNIERGRILIVSDGTNASMSNHAASLGTLGVTFTVDVSAGSIRLRYTTTSTGTAVTMKYKSHSILAA
jgi:hypothetical protein